MQYVAIILWPLISSKLGVATTEPKILNFVPNPKKTLGCAVEIFFMVCIDLPEIFVTNYNTDFFFFFLQTMIFDLFQTDFRKNLKIWVFLGLSKEKGHWYNWKYLLHKVDTYLILPMQTIP